MVDKAIPYSIVKRIILNCKDERTQALIAMQYGLGCRVGELAVTYLHRFRKYKKLNGLNKIETKGLRNIDVEYTKEFLRIKHPNFKQRKLKKRDLLPSVTGIIFKSQEEWLYNIVLNWLSKRKNEEFIFDIRRSRMSFLIDRELKKYKSEYSTHWLRHSRATHIGELTADPMAVRTLLGHARIETSMRYVNYTEAILKRRIGPKNFEDILGKSLGDDENVE